MKKLIVLFFILFAGCHLKKNGKLVLNKPVILLGKRSAAMRYYTVYSFDFYINGETYYVNVSKEFYDRYNVGDTLHGYYVIPNE